MADLSELMTCIPVISYLMLHNNLLHTFRDSHLLSPFGDFHILWLPGPISSSAGQRARVLLEFPRLSVMRICPWSNYKGSIEGKERKK